MSGQPNSSRPYHSPPSPPECASTTFLSNPCPSALKLATTLTCLLTGATLYPPPCADDWLASSRRGTEQGVPGHGRTNQAGHTGWPVHRRAPGAVRAHLFSPRLPLLCRKEMTGASFWIKCWGPRPRTSVTRRAVSASRAFSVVPPRTQAACASCWPGFAQCQRLAGPGLPPLCPGLASGPGELSAG